MIEDQNPKEGEDAGEYIDQVPRHHSVFDDELVKLKVTKNATHMVKSTGMELNESSLRHSERSAPKEQEA